MTFLQLEPPVCSKFFKHHARLLFHDLSKKKFEKYFLTLLLCFLNVNAYADETIRHASGILPPLITQHACQSCHALDAERTAPSFQSIAQRYRALSQAPSLLNQKIRQGSTGAWGTVSMPPQVMVSDEDLGKLSKWILAQRPVKPVDPSFPVNH